MSVYRDPRNKKRWRYRTRVTMPDGNVERISGSAPRANNTKAAAVRMERLHVERALSGLLGREARTKREAPFYREWAETFFALTKAKNKPSTVATRESVLRVHLVPRFGAYRLNEINYGAVQDFAVSQVNRGLAKKSVNNHLSILRTSLTVAKKRGLISSVPEIEWLDTPPPEFDFLDFGEADRLIAGADGEWGVALLLVVRTGLRLGELRALRWEDVDQVKGVVHVRQSVSRGQITSPKSNRMRSVPLSKATLAALKEHRHLRGPYVFCTMSGRMFTRNETKHPLRRARTRAGLRHLGWHVLRHTFASHLVIRGVPLKAVQELMGHATIEMTMRYAHLSPGVTARAVQVLDAPASEKVWPTYGQQPTKR